MKNNAYFSTESLTVGYNGKALISDISLNLQKGEILTLIGPNGSGKSTILKSLTRHLATISGTVYIDSKNMRTMSDPDVAETAKERGCTRAVASMEKAAKLGKLVIFAVGNAPTALLALCELIDAGKIKPELVIGVPVGFVNILEAKDAIMESGVPYIVAKGRKGGSNVAAAIVNALMYQITR